jgi:tetratricopeptide (TPR) repeat protein
VRGRWLALAVAALAAAACLGRSGGGSAGSTPDGGEAERLYEEGVSWARKAEAAPLPTPDPAAGGAAPEFKPEELRALESFEKALAAQPDHAASHLALADLLAPHALARAERERAVRAAQEAAAQRRPRRGRPPPPTPPPVATPVSLVDASVDRVIGAYRAALQADPSRAPVDRLIAFAARAGRLDAAEDGHQELLRRVRESAEPYALYGDFLVAHRADRERAIEQYRQALIWKPDDEAVRAKLADIHLARGIEHYGKQEFARAAVEFKEATKYVSDRDSERGRRLQAYLQRMREIRR